jgi:hypothetical protein
MPKDSAPTSKNVDAPAMLVLKRIGIRNFPNGQQVALYYNSKLNVNLSVPLSSDPSLKKVMTPVNEGVIGSLKQIASNENIGKVKFNNGSVENVHPEIAKQIIEIHAQLTNSNKDRFEKLINSGPAGMQKITHFIRKLREE